MKRFIIRVELHNARTAAQYERLHALLARHGIGNEIVADNGQRYRLPPAEYYCQGDTSHAYLLGIAKQCAAQVDNSYAVVVTESTIITWEGLTQVA